MKGPGMSSSEGKVIELYPGQDYCATCPECGGIE